uniref:PKD domain-containing protein n=1 Tax=Flavobacterium sp. TaxID=239 RepID=UPI003752CD67
VGIYNLSVPSSDYCSGLFNINVIQKPTSPTAITGPLIICPGIPIVYSCAPSPGLETHWQVSNGTILGSSIGNQVNIVFNPNIAGPYEVKVWYKNEICSSGIYSIVTDRAPLDLSLIQTQNPVCGSSFATYSIANSNVDSYNWSIIPESAGSIQSGQNTNEVSILWNQSAGEARIKIEVVKCKTTTVIQHLIQIINAPLSTISGNTTACTGNTTVFNLALNPSSVFHHVIWTFGDNTSQTVNYVDQSSFSISHTYLDPLTTSAIYPVTATVYGATGCIMPTSALFNITVSPSPIVSITPVSGINLCDPTNTSASYLFSVNIQNGFAGTTTIQWYKNNTIISGATSATINVQTYGEGEYYAAVTNMFNCTKNTIAFNVINICGTPCYLSYNLDASVTNTECNGFTATATLIEGTPTIVNWNNIIFPGATIVNNSPYNLTIQNVQPGKYSIQLQATYNLGASGVCTKTKQFQVIIPYKAGLKYKVTCNNGNYNVQLLDYSVFYPETPIEHFAFTLDNGLNWYPATISNGIPQFNTVLPPGSYPIGIRIDSSGYPECTYFETLVLPAMPNATFTATTHNCQDNAVQFTATDINPDLQYYWNFGGNYNLQQNPVKVFAGSGDFLVQLTVTNKYGCSATSTQFLNVIPVNMKGDLVQTPLSACQGTTATLHFQPYSGQQTPVSITWYYKNIQSPPISTTVAPNLDLVVNQSGYYIAHLTDTNGCKYEFTKAIAVGFIPVPAPPKITGTTTVCLGNAIIVKVPEDSSINYLWTINGVSQPQFNGLSKIVLTSTAVGNYSVGVIAQAGSASTGYCNSSIATMVVAVVDGPTQPEITLEVVSCQPYLVQVAVTNPQAGVNYYWSNGQSGISTTMSHDGPLQVRADLNNCSSSSQIDLPLNLETLAWVFPTGCFENCLQNPLGYIIGPLGDFTNWSWLQNGTTVASGSNTIQPFTNVVPTNDYQLMLKNGFCDLLIENLNIKEVRCEKCDIEYVIMDIRCVKVNDVYIYEVIVKTLNLYNNTLYMNFTDINGHGYFSSNTLAIPAGTTIQTMNFYPLNSFNGGLLAIEISGDLNAQTRCFKAINLQFPICEEIQPRLYNDSKTNSTKLIVAPNPASSSTSVYYSYNENSTNIDKYIEILDVLGRKMATYLVVENEGKVLIDTSSYATGSYLVLMKQNNEVLENKKLIINKF